MSETNTVSPLRQRMLEDMAARKLNPHTRTSSRAVPASRPQSDHDRGTVPVPCHAASPRFGGRGVAHQGAAEAAAIRDIRGFKAENGQATTTQAPRKAKK